MEKQSTREALIQRIADLEAELLVYRNRPEMTFASDAFGLADIDHAADGVCICHAIDDLPLCTIFLLEPADGRINRLRP